MHWKKVQRNNLGEISTQPHTTLCIQFLDRENNNKNNRLPLGKQICFTIVWGLQKSYHGLLCLLWKKKKKKRKKKGKEAIKHKAENTLTHIISCVSDWSGYRGLTIDITCVLYVPDLQ